MEGHDVPPESDEQPPLADVGGADVGAADEPSSERPVDRWRRNTASGAITAALALGLQQVFDPERKNTIGIEQEAPSGPVEPDEVDLHFDPLSSHGSVVVVRRNDGGTEAPVPPD